MVHDNNDLIQNILYVIKYVAYRSQRTYTNQMVIHNFLPIQSEQCD